MWKCSRKPVFGVLLAVFIASILALPGLFSGDSVEYYFKQLSENGDSNDNASSWLQRSSDNNTMNDPKMHCVLKVYMYDLPRKFNMGLLNSGDPDQELPWTDLDAPPWTNDYEVNKQHSVEYWLMVYLLNARNHKDEQMAAVRVNDPSQADVFFVPFFSARSFNHYGIHMTAPDAKIDQKLQEEVVDILHKSKWWQKSQGRDHVVVAHHPNAFRYDKKVARLSKDVVAPYVHVLPSYDQDNSSDPFSARKTLLFFRGRIRRKSDGWVRAKLGELLANEIDVEYTNSLAASPGNILTATEGMRTSRFCLHPAGDTPSSCRLFDAIVNHCVPVIISDKIELPFEDDLDYNEFSLFFSSEEAIKPGHLLKTLRGMQRARWLQMWTRLKAISHHFEYQHPAKKDDAVNMIFKQVQRKVPALKLAIHRSKRLQIADWWRRRR